ncbi:hypothetical protein IRZ58_01015, partial [Pseudomonas guariconensis]|nr:hypothetical protein [Pseudomonas guariconensis]
LAAVWSSSIGVLGVGLEATGRALETLRPQKLMAAQNPTVGFGGQIAKYGGGIAAAAGLMDAVQYRSSAIRSKKNGDINASREYWFASSAASASALTGIYASLAGSSLFGPLGFALVLGVSAFAASNLAKQEESTLMELWARSCKWGVPETYRHWVKASDLDVAISALNAAAIGMQADVSVQARFLHASNIHISTPIGLVNPSDAVPIVFTLKYSLRLPKFSPAHSRYEWRLVIYSTGSNGGSATLSGDSTNPERTTLADASNGKILIDTTQTQAIVHHDKKNQILLLQGALPLNDNHGINAIELLLTYWPNEHDEASSAQLLVREDKIEL